MNLVNHSLAIAAVVGVWLSVLAGSAFLWGAVGDPYAMVRYVVRLLIVVPLATCLALAAVLLFDRWTPDEWLASLTDDHHGNLGTKLATGVVVASLVLSVFWLAIQG
ncbi:MAG: hypothetical protein LDL33_11885 [Desulfomonile sp.]|nr:hypothetical protein [Desulfomonile sp.]